MFWTVKYEFPLKVVCLLLNMLPDPDYKVSIVQLPMILTKAFVKLGHSISMLIGCESNSAFFVLKKSIEKKAVKWVAVFKLTLEG